MKKLYLGNLPFTATEDEVREMLGAFGPVHSVALPTDRDTGRPRGFGFVEMPEDDTARKAIEELNGKEVDGRALTVNEARPREPRRPRPEW